MDQRTPSKQISTEICKNTMSMYRVTELLIFLSIFSCQEETTPPAEEDQTKVVEVLPDLFYGIDRNQFTVQTQKIKRGDTFGKILEDNGGVELGKQLANKVLDDIQGKQNHPHDPSTSKLLSKI